MPTVGGVILFGKERERHFPDAWIQTGRFEGTDKSRIVDRAEIRSLPVRAVDEAIAFVEKHALHGAEIGRVRRKERWNLPPTAVREAIISAVAHTDYAQRGAPLRLSIFDDRLEVENPGLLPFGLTIEDLPRGVSKLRNRVIGRGFHALGLIEQWGSGIQRHPARQDCGAGRQERCTSATSSANRASARYFAQEMYAEVAREVIRAMQGQVGKLTVSEEGPVLRGLLVRHLVMPGMLEDTRAILGWVAELSRDTYVNVMEQYHPAWKATTDPKYAAINRALHPSPTRARSGSGAWTAAGGASPAPSGNA